MGFLHGGRPRLSLSAHAAIPQRSEPHIKAPASLNEPLLKILAGWNVCSKEWVIRQYDFEVEGGSVLKPLVGLANDGPGDAAVIKPVLDSKKGLIISNGLAARYGDLNPYWMAASAIDEALRQVIAVGGSLDEVALLDNFCWGSVKDPASLGALVRACEACYDMAMAYGTPFVSGKDSLNNEYTQGKQHISIPHTLLISAMGVMEDADKAVSMDFKKPGDLIYLLGETSDELGGSEYYALHHELGANVPRVNPQAARVLMESLSRATARGLVRACHDLSEGGLGVALAEMSFAGGLGAEVNLARVPFCGQTARDDTLLFSESNSRFLAEVEPGQQAEFEKTIGGACALIGRVTPEAMLRVTGLKGGQAVSLSIAALKESWQAPLRW
jgi:phosphoribosylformylglycinamidine synthase subunit PurSL